MGKHIALSMLIIFRRLQMRLQEQFTSVLLFFLYFCDFSRFLVSGFNMMLFSLYMGLVYMHGRRVQVCFRFRGLRARIRGGGLLLAHLRATAQVAFRFSPCVLRRRIRAFPAK